jgi:hypothetical protein
MRERSSPAEVMTGTRDFDDVEGEEGEKGS